MLGEEFSMCVCVFVSKRALSVSSSTFLILRVIWVAKILQLLGVLLTLFITVFYSWWEGLIRGSAAVGNSYQRSKLVRGLYSGSAAVGNSYQWGMLMRGMYSGSAAVGDSYQWGMLMRGFYSGSAAVGDSYQWGMKSEMSINFKSIREITPFHGTEFTDVFFILRDMLYLCVMCYQQ